MADPAQRQILSDSARRAWARRQGGADIAAQIERERERKHGGARPEAAAALRRLWADPEFRARQAEGARAALRRLWADPQYRARQAEAFARGHAAARARRQADPASVAAAVEQRERERARDRARKREARRYKHVPTPLSEARRKAQIRPCMCCRGNFRSEGPHNRLCQRCTRIPVSPFEPD